MSKPPPAAAAEPESRPVRPIRKLRINERAGGDSRPHSLSGQPSLMTRALRYLLLRVIAVALLGVCAPFAAAVAASLPLQAPADSVVALGPVPAANDSTEVPAHDSQPVIVSPDSLPALRAATRGVDYMWVLRDALMTPASIDSVVERAARMHVKGLLVQVVGRGDAWYASRLLPRAEPLDSRSDADPLAHMVQRAHASGLEVHAWMNCLLVWSGKRYPRDYRHVVRAHPDWIAELQDGRRTSWVTARGLKKLNLEGAYLAPARPGVRRFVASIAAEIATNYAVDGIHLDYIRQPDAETGFDPDTRARFALFHGADPQRFNLAPPARRDSLMRLWRQFQHDQVTAVVRAVRDTLQSIRPGISLSAAVVSDPARSEGSTAQNWRGWLHDGLLDRAYVMCYSPEVQTVMDQLLSIGQELGASQRVVPGIAVYNTSPVTAAVKLRGARALGYPLLALYSYDSLFALDRGWKRLEQGLVSQPSAAEH